MSLELTRDAIKVNVADSMEDSSLEDYYEKTFLEKYEELVTIFARWTNANLELDQA